MWPAWAKSNRKDLARFVHEAAAGKLKLDKVRDDLLAEGDRRGVAEAIYDAARAADIRWSRELYDPREEVQGIRDPFDVLEGSGDATCLDLALLYAGLCLGNELLPLIAVFRDHALVLVGLDNGRREAGKRTRKKRDGTWTETGLLDDASQLAKLIADGAYLPIECTGFARSHGAIPDNVPEGKRRVEGRMSFDDAVAVGKEQFDFAERKLVFAVDPAVLLDVEQNEAYEPPSIGFANLKTDLRLRLREVFDAHRLFGGREEELRALDAAAASDETDFLFVTGVSGTGKTALLTNWVAALEGRDDVQVCYHFLSRQHGLARREDMLRTLCQQLANAHGHGGALPGSVEELHALYIELLTDNARADPLVVLIDGLDEADGWKVDSTLFPRPLSDNITMVFSAREIADKDWLKDLGFKDGEAETLTVERLSRSGVVSLLRAAGAAAASAADEDEFVDLLYARSGGDPLYLRFVVGDIRDGRIANVAQLKGQPQGLSDYFKRWWQEEVSKHVRAKAVQDLLGYLLVSRGRLNRDDLIGISDVDALDAFSVDEAVQVLSRYVVGDEKAGFALCHPRFREYLVGGPLKSVPKTFRERLVDWCAHWQAHRSPYALSYYAIHLAEALEGSEGAAKGKLADDLVALVGSREYQETFMQVSGDFPWLHRQVSIALERVVQLSGEEATARTVRAALALPELRGRWLRPELVFEAAAEGRVEDARKAVALFGAAQAWHEIGLLLIAWIAGDADAEAGKALLEEVELGDWLPVLKGRVRAALQLDREPEYTFSYPPRNLQVDGVDEIRARMILSRLAGADPEGMDPEQLGAMISGFDHEMIGDEVSVRVAQQDAPSLVRFAIDQPDPGLRLLQRYIELHATNPYREYRNASLWQILEAVLCIPDRRVALRLARSIVEKGLGGGTVEYREGLRLALEVRRFEAALPGARSLDDKVKEAREAADRLESDRLISDQWGHHGRRLAALAEILARLSGDRVEAVALLDVAEQLPFGYAGFQAIASLAVAEANHVCEPGDAARVDALLEKALRSAHNVQDPAFCALITARVNGVTGIWRRRPQDLGDLAERFLAETGAAEFSSSWRVPEPFQHRDRQREMIRLPDSMVQARSLEALAGTVFMIPVAELVRLNPGVDVSQPLAQEVSVPDAATAPLVAALLSAWVLADDTDPDVKVARIQRLVPVAAANATALDTVLMRLLLARPLGRPDLLDALDEVAPRDWMKEHTWVLAE